MSPVWAKPTVITVKYNRNFVYMINLVGIFILRYYKSAKIKGTLVNSRRYIIRIFNRHSDKISNCLSLTRFLLSTILLVLREIVP